MDMITIKRNLIIMLDASDSFKAEYYGVDAKCLFPFMVKASAQRQILSALGGKSGNTQQSINDETGLQNGT